MSLWSIGSKTCGQQMLTSKTTHSTSKSYVTKGRTLRSVGCLDRVTLYFVYDKNRNNRDFSLATELRR